MTTLQRFGIRRVLLAIAVAVAVLPALAQTPAKRAFTPGDWYSVKTLSAPVMSPDGKYVAVQVTNVIEAKNTRMNEIWVASTAPGAGEPQRFTAPGFDSTNPSFSTDSSLLIFNSTRPGYSSSRWAVRVDGPGGEFEHATPGGGSAAPDAGGGDFANAGGRAGGPGANLNASSPKDNSFTVSTGVPGGAVTGAGRAGGGGAARGGGGGGGSARGGAPAGTAPPAPTTPATAPAGAPAGPRPVPASSTEAYAAMPPMAKPPAGAITLPLDPSRFDGMQIIDTRFKANGRGFVPSTGTTLAGRGAGAGAAAGGGAGRNGGAAVDGPPTQVLIDKKDGAGAQPLTNTLYSHREARVSPDGKWIVFAADAELRPDTDLRAVREEIAKLGTDAARAAATREKLQTELYLIPAAGGTGAPKRIRTSGNETGVAWSSDSRWFTFTANAGANTNTNIYLADATTGTSKSLTGDLRTDGGPTAWLPSGDLLMQVNVGGRNALYRINPRTGDRKEIVGGRRRVFGFTYDTARTKVAYIASPQEAPNELYLADLDGNERQLSHFNKDVNATIAWSPSERFTFKSVGDVEVEAWLVKPFGYEPGKRYPLVLYIHGGPHSAYNEGWFDEFQNLAGAGMWVLYTNPRGSSGYGAEFQDMIRARWGDEDYMDLMKAVDIAAARPDVDPERLGVTGGSYGGFMTAWITTKTTRFKAAETDRMIANWLSWYGSSDAQSLTEGEFLGTPWQSWDLYVNLSPIKYADKVKTPTLLVQSEEDYRAPIGDAEQWFMALKKNGVPAEFVRYPQSNHELSRSGEPWLLTDRLNRIRQWFGYWLKDEKPQR